MTVEVRNQTIVQAYGYCNRSMVTRERKIIASWAALAGLEIDVPGW